MSCRTRSARVETLEEARWSAVLLRDPAADGRFVYAVATTRIFCRPTCPSRRPGRDRVTFYDTAAAAAQAGYRPCRRCLPDAPEPSSATRVRAAREFLDEHLDETVTLERLGQAVGLSPSHLQRSFKRMVGVSPRAYVGARRLDRMKTRMRQGASVTRAAFDAGYSSASRVSHHSRQRLGMSPGAYRNGGRGERIRFTTLALPVDTVLVAATSRGICAVTLGGGPAELEAGLRREFPAAAIERDDRGMTAWAGTVVARLSGDEGAQPPLDIGGTAFQLRVWEALARIPSGATRTYAEIARELGQPTAARAVAGACASNRLAIVIPCHRVVRGDGGLGGYRWGIDRKRRILEEEAGG